MFTLNASAPEQAPQPIGGLLALPAPFIAPTLEVAGAYQAAYDYFNAALFEAQFGEKLPHVILNLSRKGRGHTTAFFAPSRWKQVKDGTVLAEISLVPEHTDRPLRDVFATLCHEMAHFKDDLDQTSCKNGYHGRAWFKIMKRIGLPGLALSKSMLKVSHEIEDGGAYDLAFEAMPIGLKMPFVGSAPPRVWKKPTLQGVRIKYECPSCGLNVRGRTGLHLRCMTCDEPLHDSGI